MHRLQKEAAPDVKFATKFYENPQSKEAMNVTEPEEPNKSQEAMDVTEPEEPNQSQETMDVTEPEEPNKSQKAMDVTEPEEPDKSQETMDVAEPEEPNKNQESASLRRTSRKPKPKISQSKVDESKSISDACKKVDWDKLVAVDLFSRPWIKVDGTLNRKVFDRMLGSILGYAMQKPGQPLVDITKKFSPAIQPYQTQELIEILEEMGCLKLVKLVKPTTKCSLFKKSQGATLTDATIIDDPEEIIVEPNVDAVVILGQFIGDKQQLCDIYQCPCHPRFN